MRVFVAGATGLIGARVVDLLLEAGHEVGAHTRGEDTAEPLRERGVAAAVADVYDAEQLRMAMGLSQPEVVIHQLTALPRRFDPARAAEQFAANDRIRVEGTRNLVEAAAAAGVGRIVAQSVAFAYAPVGERMVDEDAPLFLDAPAPWGASVGAAAELERQVMEASGMDGVVLRYGHLYGPGTYFAPEGQTAERVCARGLPLVGEGRGVFSFVHVDDAAAAAVAALGAPPGIYNVVDDDPIEARDWLSLYARALDAPEPERIDEDAALERLGWIQVHRMTEQRGASNARARERFGWRPRHATWRRELEARAH